MVSTSSRSSSSRCVSAAGQRELLDPFGSQLALAVERSAGCDSARCRTRARLNASLTKPCLG
jgi:hypothetical protein